MLRKAIFSLLFILTAVILWQFSLRPSNDRDFATELDRLAEVSQVGDVYVISNVRSWMYEGDQITSRDWVSRTVDPDRLERVWFVVEPFGAWDGIAHTYFTFDFTDAPPLSFSIEARKELDEKYTPIRGVFRQYELAYSWGEETDLLARRAVYLDHQVYMYPLRIEDDWGKSLLRTLLVETAKLESQPKFYNTLTHNCTNMLVHHVNTLRPGTIPFHPARLFTGYSDNLLYDLGYIPNDEEFKMIKEKANVTKLVKDLQGSDFSEELRGSLFSQIPQR